MRYNYYNKGRIVVKELIWDDWNREHLIKHDISPEEVKEVFVGNYQTVESYRKRILIVGKTKTERNLAVILSPEDRDLKVYGDGIYYVITAFEKDV